MKFASQIVAPVLIGAAVLVCSGCPGTLPGEVADLGTPAPCTAAEDCPEGINCILANEGDETGFCDIEETQVQ